MISTLYIIILSYFILGGIAFYFINRKKDKKTASKNRTKYITYFLIINILFLSIVFERKVFHFLSILIVVIGIGEIARLFIKSGYKKRLFFTSSLILFLVFCGGFVFFSLQSKELILFSFLVLSIFDAFSQISGQLLGRKKIFPAISPNKTLEGLAGGSLIAILSALLLKDVTGMQTHIALLLAAGIVIFAFMGDMAMSFYKRNYAVKDFSNLMPGHGGILDRFDSLIAGGAFVALFNTLFV
jgi:phosphatidate cytidylyltransferase